MDWEKISDEVLIVARVNIWEKVADRSESGWVPLGTKRCQKKTKGRNGGRETGREEGGRRSTY